MTDPADPTALVKIRLRLPGRTDFLYVLREFNGVVDKERFPGAEPLLTRSGRAETLPGPDVRRRWWRQMTAAFSAHLEILG
jgi:hypothetical protein